jgi:hypothetical protein
MRLSSGDDQANYYFYVDPIRRTKSTWSKSGSITESQIYITETVVPKMFTWYYSGL